MERGASDREAGGRRGVGSGRAAGWGERQAAISRVPIEGRAAGRRAAGGERAVGGRAVGWRAGNVAQLEKNLGKTLAAWATFLERFCTMFLQRFWPS